MVILLIVLASPSLGPRTVPATAPDPFVAADDAAWARVRAEMPASVVVLRPTWIPAEFRGTGQAGCPSPQVAVQNADRTYVVSYFGSSFTPPNSGRSACTRLEFKTLKLAPEDSFYGVQLVDQQPLSSRGTSVRVRFGPRVVHANGAIHQLIYLNWTEAGISYELNTLDVDLADLTRVLVGLQPMR
ncbi:MAG TPA: hypothetical protein VFM06_10480 [Candidatus Limnocylindria bacterium]|nr:hypothetical protein [Candidatus Limnocylindria bacterium]